MANDTKDPDLDLGDDPEHNPEAVEDAKAFADEMKLWKAFADSCWNCGSTTGIHGGIDGDGCCTQCRGLPPEAWPTNFKEARQRVQKADESFTECICATDSFLNAFQQLLGTSIPQKSLAQTLTELSPDTEEELKNYATELAKTYSISVDLFAAALNQDATGLDPQILRRLCLEINAAVEAMEWLDRIANN